MAAVSIFPLEEVFLSDEETSFLVLHEAKIKMESVMYKMYFNYPI
jgi:hypothetical protein